MTLVPFPQNPPPEFTKFGAHLEPYGSKSPCGGVSTLFATGHLLGLPSLLPVEGEFDCLLAWQYARDLCDSW